MIGYANALSVYPLPNSIKGALFNGTEIMSTGLFTDTLQITTTIQYSTGNMVYPNSADAASAGDNPHVELIWAHNTINKLLDLLLINPTDQNLKDEIVDIAVSYGIVVPNYTALTIVLEEPTDDSVFNESPVTFTNSWDQIGGRDSFAEANTQTQDSDSPLSFFAIIISIPVMIIALRKRRVT